jgi:hypothetical protein
VFSKILGLYGLRYIYRQKIKHKMKAEKHERRTKFSAVNLGIVGVGVLRASNFGGVGTHLVALEGLVVVKRVEILSAGPIELLVTVDLMSVAVRKGA